MNVPLPALFGPIFHRMDGSKFRTPAALQRLLEEAGFKVLCLRRFWALSPAQLFTALKP